MNSLNKNRIKIIKKRDPKSIEPTRVEVLRCGARVTRITFPKRKDGKVKGIATYHSDFSIPVVTDITVFDEVQDDV